MASCFLCRLRSIAAHSDHVVWRLSVCPSVRLCVFVCRVVTFSWYSRIAMFRRRQIHFSECCHYVLFSFSGGGTPIWWFQRILGDNHWIHIFTTGSSRRFISRKRGYFQPQYFFLKKQIKNPINKTIYMGGYQCVGLVTVELLFCLFWRVLACKIVCSVAGCFQSHWYFFFILFIYII